MPTDTVTTSNIRAGHSTERRAQPAHTGANESTGSPSSSGLRRLHWELVIAIDLASGAECNLPGDAAETFVVEAGTMIAVQGRSDRDAYVYMAVIAEATREVFLYAENGEAVQVEAGKTTRIPADGWFAAPTAGTICVVSALRPLSLEELAEGLCGRQPKPQVSTIENRRTATPAPTRNDNLLTPQVSTIDDRLAPSHAPTNDENRDDGKEAKS